MFGDDNVKKKYIKNTYLLGVEDYDIKIITDKRLNSYVSVKYIKDIDKPYIEGHTGKNICLMKNGYYLLEYLPINDNYTVRVFLNDKKEVQQYYIDITKENGYEDDSPYYLDLYLDITIDVHCDNKTIVWDEDELEEALNTNDITKEDYDMAYTVLKRLLSQIADGTNKIITNDHKNMVEDILDN